MSVDKKILVVAIIQGDGNELIQLSNVFMNLNIAGVECELYLIFNGCESRSVKSLDPLYPNLIKRMREYKEARSVSRCLNEAILSNHYIGKDYLCFMPSNCQLSYLWLREMLYWQQRIDNSAITGISSSAVSLMPLPSKLDGTEYVNVPDTWTTYETRLISAQTIHELGAFNENLFSGYEWEDYVRRAKKQHLHSFNSPGTYSIVILSELQSTWYSFGFETTPEKYLQQFQAAPDFLPFYLSDPEWQNKQKTIYSFVESMNEVEPNMEAKPFIDLRTGNYGFTKSYLNMKLLEMVSEYSRDHGLIYFVACSDEISTNEIRVVFLKNQ